VPSSLGGFDELQGPDIAGAPPLKLRLCCVQSIAPQNVAHVFQLGDEFVVCVLVLALGGDCVLKLCERLVCIALHDGDVRKVYEDNGILERVVTHDPPRFLRRPDWDECPELVEIGDEFEEWQRLASGFAGNGGERRIRVRSSTSQKSSPRRSRRWR
jgi:hypothetical protein